MHNLDPSLQTENIAFDAKDLIACGGCGRKNPPNRLKCLYCSHELEIREQNAASIKANLRKLELWEHGFNVICLMSTTDEIDANAIGKLLSMEPSNVELIVEAGTSLPLARVESEKEAELIANGVRSLGVDCSILSDVALAADKMPVRLSSIEIHDNSFALTDFNTGKITEVMKSDLVLIIPGIITAGKVDALVKKRRGKETKILDEMTTDADESILDIYTRQDKIGFRIRTTGFDFSCLEHEKGLLATENLKLLAERLKAEATNAKIVSSYPAARHALNNVWEIESRKDSKGLQRSGFGKVEFGTVASTNNLDQFTKFSRLQWHLL